MSTLQCPALFEHQDYTTIVAGDNQFYGFMVLLISSIYLKFMNELGARLIYCIYLTEFPDAAHARASLEIPRRN